MDSESPELYVTIGRNVRAERVRRGWTQVRLARELQWSRAMVSDLERGARDLRIGELPRLCRAVGVGLGELVAGGDPADLAVMRLAAVPFPGRGLRRPLR